MFSEYSAIQQRCVWRELVCSKKRVRCSGVQSSIRGMPRVAGCARPGPARGTRTCSARASRCCSGPRSRARSSGSASPRRRGTAGARRPGTVLSASLSKRLCSGTPFQWGLEPRSPGPHGLRFKKRFNSVYCPQPTTTHLDVECNCPVFTLHPRGNLNSVQDNSVRTHTEPPAARTCVRVVMPRVCFWMRCAAAKCRRSVASLLCSFDWRMRRTRMEASQLRTSPQRVNKEQKASHTVN